MINTEILCLKNHNPLLSLNNQLQPKKKNLLKIKLKNIAYAGCCRHKKKDESDDVQNKHSKKDEQHFGYRSRETHKK